MVSVEQCQCQSAAAERRLKPSPWEADKLQKQFFLLLIWGQDCVYRLYYVHSLLSALPRPESGMHMPWEQFNNDILSISIFVHIKKNTTATLPVRFFLHCSFQSPKTLKKKQDFCWKGKPETDLEDYLNLNLVLVSMWPVFSGAIRVFKVFYAEARQEIYRFILCFKIVKSLLLKFSADYLGISLRYFWDRIAWWQR